MFEDFSVSRFPIPSLGTFVHHRAEKRGGKLFKKNGNFTRANAVLPFRRKKIPSSTYFFFAHLVVTTTKKDNTPTLGSTAKRTHAQIKTPPSLARDGRLKISTAVTSSTQIFSSSRRESTILDGGVVVVVAHCHRDRGFRLTDRPTDQNRLIYRQLIFHRPF